MFDFQHPDADVRHDFPFGNYAGTIKKSVPLWCAPKRSADGDVTGLKRNADVISRLLTKCFEPPGHPIRLSGSRWSFSSVLQPENVVLDPGNMSFTMPVDASHLAASYAQRTKDGFVPFYAQGGTGISLINERLGALRLALQTSGGGNGHRIAGCIATGTHGAALEVGALHDTVLAMHLITGPKTAVLVQPSWAPFKPELAGWLEQHTGIPTQNLADDALFHATQVSLGSLGVVFGVIVEATPLYTMAIRRQRRKFDDDAVWHAIRTLDTTGLNNEFGRKADFFMVTVLPYPGDDRSALFVTMMWKQPAGNEPFRSPKAEIVRQSSDTIGFIGGLAQNLGNAVTTGLVRNVVQAKIHEELRDDHKTDSETLFPGEVFGPTTLPGGKGASVELALDARHASRALNTVMDTIEKEAHDVGRFLLGCVALRFTKKSDAFLAMNQHEKTCHIELPSIRTPDVQHIYQAIYRAMDAADIPFACHWGQMGGFTPQRTQRYYGANAGRWTAARQRLLADPVARRVFGAPILLQSGL